VPTAPSSIPPPVAKHWQDWADEYLAGPLGDFLDFGCGPGDFLHRVAPRCTRVVGVDMDEEKLQAARARVPRGEFVRLVPNTALPFAAETFDNASILEVIEHVPKERPVLRDLARVLKPGGRLLLTTPHRGLLTFLDVGNVKFFVPGFHKFVHYHLLRNRAYYDNQFGSERRSDGMIGDFALQDRAWHRHYRLDEIRRLAPPNLRVERWGVYFPFLRALSFLRMGIWALSRGRRKTLPAALVRKRVEFSTRRGWAGDQLVVLFRKH
jgi:SAM-dependent methyltransferase